MWALFVSLLKAKLNLLDILKANHQPKAEAGQRAPVFL